MCNKADFFYMRDYGLERYLTEREVWCSKKAKGCTWKGKLKNYAKHLNDNPTPDKQLSGCRFVDVMCVHGCGELVLRCKVAAHQNDECSERPYYCKFCNDYESTFKDVVKSHYAECSYFPISCPNKCQPLLFERQKLEGHIKNECPLVVVECPLRYAGCAVQLPRKDLVAHMKDTATHLTLLATVTRQILTDNRELKRNVEELKEENHKLR